MSTVNPSQAELAFRGWVSRLGSGSRDQGRGAGFLGMQPCVKSSRSSFTGLYPQRVDGCGVQGSVSSVPLPGDTIPCKVTPIIRHGVVTT